MSQSFKPTDPRKGISGLPILEAPFSPELGASSSSFPTLAFWQHEFEHSVQSPPAQACSVAQILLVAAIAGTHQPTSFPAGKQNQWDKVCMCTNDFTTSSLDALAWQGYSPRQAAVSVSCSSVLLILLMMQWHRPDARKISIG